MNKTKANFIIDGLLFLGMMFLTGSGLVQKYILLSGSASRQVFGKKVDMLMLGFNRDDWSTIHLYFGYFMLFLLLLHIVLHWKQIKVMYKQLINNSALRTVIMVAFMIASIILVVFPFIIAPSIIP
ncbi:MAG: DUF4405 domain-containing protein [Methanomethylovorans sp.]|nr:DUF4405 domain-containing protein [Methanomethylovorans sp.]